MFFSLVTNAGLLQSFSPHKPYPFLTILTFRSASIQTTSGELNQEPRKDMLLFLLHCDLNQNILFTAFYGRSFNSGHFVKCNAI